MSHNSRTGFNGFIRSGAIVPFSFVLLALGFIFYGAYQAYQNNEAQEKASQDTVAAMVAAQAAMQAAAVHEQELRDKNVAQLIEYLTKSYNDASPDTLLGGAMQLLGQEAALYCPIAELQELIEKSAGLQAYAQQLGERLDECTESVTAAAMCYAQFVLSSQVVAIGEAIDRGIELYHTRQSFNAIMKRAVTIARGIPPNYNDDIKEMRKTLVRQLVDLRERGVRVIFEADELDEFRRGLGRIFVSEFKEWREFLVQMSGFPRDSDSAALSESDEEFILAEFFRNPETDAAMRASRAFKAAREHGCLTGADVYEVFKEPTMDFIKLE